MIIMIMKIMKIMKREKMIEILRSNQSEDIHCLLEVPLLYKDDEGILTIR